MPKTTKPVYVRELTAEERTNIEAGLRSSNAFTLRRSQIFLASARGETARHIAAHLGCSDQTVRDAIHAFNAKGLAALQPGSNRPHTIRRAFDETGLERLQGLLHESPRKYGKGSSVWTLEAVADVSYAEGITPDEISDETVRLALKRLGVRWKRAKQWITSPDPQYKRKKTRATG